jgi:hypothetical protein
MFIHIWSAQPIINGHKRCFVSNLPLTKYQDSDLFWSMFAHVLPKGRFTKWKLNPSNVVLLDPQIHWLYDQGTNDARIKSGYNFTPLYDLKQELTNKYDQNGINVRYT